MMIEPRLVYVKEKCAKEFDCDDDACCEAVYGLPIAFRGEESPLPLGRRARDANGLFLPADVYTVILSFIPMQAFPQCATVCRNWLTMTQRVASLNLKEARGLLTEGLELMAVTNSPLRSVELFTRAIDTYPRLAEASFWKAKGLFILNEDSSAVECLEDALAQKPTVVERLKLQACVCYARNDDQKASQLLEAALQHAPQDPSVHFELGFCYHGLQQFARAVACYSRALELGYSRTFVLLANRANCLFRVGKVSACLRDLEASLAISPQYELALRTRAFVNLQLGDPQQAHRDYTAIIASSPSPRAISDAYCNRAFCFGDMEEADIESARTADPTNPEPVRFKASVLVNRGAVPEAIALMTTWIAANAAHKELAHQLAFRGELFASLNDWGAAIADYQGAVAAVAGGAVGVNYGPGSGATETLATYRDRLHDLKAHLKAHRALSTVR